MTLRLLWPPALLGLLALPLLLRARPRDLPAAGARAAATIFLVLALAGLSVERNRPLAGTCLVAVVDVSGSVGRAAVDAARTTLAGILPRLGAHDTIGSVAFASRARVVARPRAGATLDDLLPSPDFDAGDTEAGGTDLAAALARAAPLCPTDAEARLLFFTDGNETTGSLLAEVALTQPPMPIFPIVPPPASLPGAVVRRLIVPALAPAGTLLPLEAVVEARRPLSAALRLEVNGGGLLPIPLEIPAGLSVIPLPYRFARPGQYLLQAGLLLPPTEPAAPARVTAPTTVSRPIHVLVAAERGASVVAAALAERDMDVELVSPAGLATRTLRLADYHLVVLDDVASAALPAATLAALARWVAAGGALVATGGEHLFGDPGFAGSALERVLPVELQSQTPEPAEREPIALYLLIDRSNSMGYATSEPTVKYGEKMEYAKRAALAVLDQLGPSDLVGAIAFDSRPHELGALLPVGKSRDALAERIRSLQYGGGTDFKDALEIALLHLLESHRRVRHVILLTDGDTNRRADDHATLVGAYARAEITITTIRIGSDVVNLDLLGAISRATGGEFHHVENVQALPQLMIHDTQRLIDTAASRRDAPARIGAPGPVLQGFTEDELPTVARWALTRPKADAELRLYVEAGARHDPILATWQYELGRVAALPLDFQAGAAGWAIWRGFAKLWAQLARWAAPAGLAAEHRLEVERRPTGTLVRLTTMRDEAGPFVLRIVGHDDVLLGPTGRRRFSAVVSDLAAGRHEALLSTAAAGAAAEPVALLVPAGPADGREYRALAPNLSLLARAAELTGGRMAPEPASLLAARPGVAREVRPLAALLVPLAMLAVLADVALRRRGR